MPDYIGMGAGDIDKHIPALTVDIANQGLGYLGKYIAMARNVQKDFGATFMSKGKTVSVPKRGALSVNDKTTKFNVTRQNPGDTDVVVTLDKHKEVTFLIEDVASAMAVPGTMEGYAKDAAIVLAEAIEQSIADLYAEAGNTFAITAIASSDWVTALTQARRILVHNKMSKLDQPHANLDEYAYEALLNNAKLTDAAQAGNDQAIKEGLARRVRGVMIDENQVVGIDTTTSPDTYYPLVYAPNAIALAVRPLPDYGSKLGVQQMTVMDERVGLALRSTVSYDPNALGVQVTLDVLYGVKVMRAEHIVAITHQLGGNV